VSVAVYRTAPQQLLQPHTRACLTFSADAPARAGSDVAGGTTDRHAHEEVDDLRRRLDAAVRHAVKAEASAQRCQQDLAAERQQHQRSLAAFAERVQVAEARTTEVHCALGLGRQRVARARASALRCQKDSAVERR
jgi:hypothetical protein